MVDETTETIITLSLLFLLRGLCEGLLEEIVAEQGPKEFSFKTLSSATESFHAKNKLGKGGFAQVYKLNDGREIAVKRPLQISDKGKELVLNELKLLLGSAHHRNIVKFLGFCSHREEMLLVFEFASNGSLDYLLFTSLLPQDQTQVNISEAAGTLGYSAPEYKCSGHVSPKADIYGFGVVVLELISGQKNWLSHDRSSSGQGLRDRANELYKEGRVSDFMDRKLIPSVVRDQVELCIQIGIMCTEYDPELRPSMGHVYSMLSENHGSSSNVVEEPIEPVVATPEEEEEEEEDSSPTCSYDQANKGSNEEGSQTATDGGGG
ncbi:hypothetical protein TEA_001986 [Camellia sinensis var. sinensis]|uniref:Protein kinase domain-containing protein n=1 Tax=Camellia sinensis var. sinensis TaxID=542762 RepID=A0A4S4DYX6_CAMSN|nr:hypothetical protein TEA_001986 [Camellia sinensis var. sinensis]